MTFCSLTIYSDNLPPSDFIPNRDINNIITELDILTNYDA